MTDSITIYYDYTCPYSYRALLWLRQLERAGRKVDLRWKTFSLKEVNASEGEPSVFERGRQESIGVLALQLAKAAQEAGADAFERYHEAVYDAMQGEGRRVAVKDLIEMAGDAGLDVTRLEMDREQGRWLQEVARDHQEGSERWGVFGTPTVVFDDESAAYLKFTEPPASPSDAAEVYDALRCLARHHPELVEIKQPRGAS